MPAPLPEDDIEIAALVRWLDIYFELLDRRYPPPSSPEPKPKPWADLLTGITPRQTVTS